MTETPKATKQPFSPRERGVLFATILGSGMAFLAGTVISIALPTIQADFDIGLTAVQWIVNSYTLTLAVLILIAGALGDIYGRRKMFMMGIAVFCVGSALSGFSPNVHTLIAFQTLQGIGAALMIPGSLALINANFEPSRQGRAIGLWAGLSGGVAAFGPFLGGWLVETFSWPAVFFINIPIGIATILLTRAYVKESKSPDNQPLDIPGVALVAISLLSIALALMQAPLMGWSHPLIIAGVVTGIVSTVLFVHREKVCTHPLVPLHLFRNPHVTAANLATLFLYFALNGMIFFIVFNFQQVQDMTPTAAGMGLLPPIILITFLSGYGGALADKYGPRLPMILGPLIVALGMLLLILPGTDANYFRDFLPGLSLFGIGMALVIASLTKAALDVEEKYSGVASGVNNAVSRIAAMLSIAILGAVMIGLFSSRLQHNIAEIHLPQEYEMNIMSQSDKLGAIQLPDELLPQHQEHATQAIKESFVDAYRRVMSINLVLTLLAALIAATMIKKKD